MTTAVEPQHGTSHSSIIDPLEREIFRYTAMSITEELEINITLTAYSLLIQESQDYCIALVTPNFRPYAFSEASIPIFLSDMGEPIRDAVEVIGLDRLRDGDVFVTNYGSGQHINNCMLGVPLFHGRTLAGYLAIRAHWVDFGGLVPGGQSMGARSIFHEGTRYRGLRIVSQGEIVPEVLATIQANSYQSEALTGDLMAQLAACALGVRRWKERIVPRWSISQLEALTSAQLCSSADFARRAISAIPDGIYTAGHSWAFSQGGIDLDMRLEVRLVVDGDRMICDLSGMPPQTELPINAGVIGGGMAAARLAFRYLIDGDVPTDAGFFEPLEIILPEGTIVSATDDAPMGFWNMTIPVVIDLFIRAIGNSHPELVPASHFAVVGGLLMSGKRPDGSVWRTIEAAIGGLGAEQDADGYGPVKCLLLGNMKSVPIEMTEGRFPIRYHSYSLDRQSGGEGRFRGGPGVEKIVEVLSDVSFDAYAAASEPAAGLAGGRSGKLGYIHVKVAGTNDWVEPSQSRLARGWLPAGSFIRQLSGGGGGWGEPPGHDDRRKVLQRNDA